MAMHRVDLLINMDEGGWSESYYIDAADVGVASGKASTLKLARGGLLNDRAIVAGWRVQPLNSFGQPSGRGYVTDRRAGPQPTSAPGARDQFTTSWLIEKADSGNLHRSRSWLRGLPDPWVAYTTAGKITWPTASDPSWDNFKNIITTEQWQVRFFNNDPNNNPWPLLQTVRFTTEGYLEVVLQVNPVVAFVPGDYVRIRKYTGEIGPGVNGKARVIAVEDGTTLTLNRISKHCADEETVGGLAELAYDRYSFNAIVFFDRVRPTSHKTGRPFFSPLGRRGSQRGCRVTRAGGV